MKAVVATDYGPPEAYTVADVPVPRPGRGQIQVRIAAASINPADVRLPSGDFRDTVPLTFPHVPGNDFAGTVSEVSEVGAGVTADLLRGLGAQETIGYAETEYPSGVDAAVNLTLPSDHLTGLARAIRGGGRLLTITYPVPEQEWIGRDDVLLRFVLDMDGTFGGIREVADLAIRGELPATIGRRYTLGQGPQACVDFTRRHTTGKLVVTI